MELEKTASPDDCMDMDATGLPPRPSPQNVPAREAGGDSNGTSAHGAAQDGIAPPTIEALDDDEPPIPVLQVADHEKETKGPQLHDGPSGPPLPPHFAALDEEDLASKAAISTPDYNLSPENSVSDPSFGDGGYAGGGELPRITSNLQTTAGDQTYNPSRVHPFGLNANVSTIDLPRAIAVDNEIIEATPTPPFWKQRRVRIMLGLVILAAIILIASLSVSFTRDSTVTMIVETTSPPTVSLVPTPVPSLAPSTSLEPSSAPSSCDAKIYATKNVLQMPQQNPDTPAFAIDGRDMIIVSRNELLHSAKSTSSLYITFYHRSEETNDWERVHTEIQSNIDWSTYCGTWYEVSLSDDTAVVGVPTVGIFVFKKNSFDLWEKVQSPDVFYWAGRSVAVGNGLLVMLESQWCTDGIYQNANDGEVVHFFAESGNNWVTVGQPLTFYPSWEMYCAGVLQTTYDYVLVSGNMIAVGRLGDERVDLYHYDESKRDIDEREGGEDCSLNKYVHGLAQVSSLPAVGRVSFYGETRLAAFHGYGSVSIHSIDDWKVLQIIRSNSTGFGRSIDSDEDLLMISSDDQVHFYSENASGLFEELLSLDLDYGSYRLSDRNLLVVNGGNSSIHTIDISECIPSADISKADVQGEDDCYDVNVTVEVCAGELDVTLQTSEFIASDATVIDLNRMGFVDYDDFFYNRTGFVRDKFYDGCGYSGSKSVFGTCVRKGRYQLNALAGWFNGYYTVSLSVEGLSQNGRFVIKDCCSVGGNLFSVDRQITFDVPFKETDDQPPMAPSLGSPAVSEEVSTSWPTFGPTPPVSIHSPSISMHPSETFRPSPIPSNSMHPSETFRPTPVPSISKSPAVSEASLTSWSTLTANPTPLPTYGPAPFHTYSPMLPESPSWILNFKETDDQPPSSPTLGSPAVSEAVSTLWPTPPSSDATVDASPPSTPFPSDCYKPVSSFSLPPRLSWTHQAKLLAPGGFAYDGFGNRVAIYENTIVAGAGGSSSGSAHVFVRSEGGWTHQAILLAPDGAAGDWFGESVAIFENTIVVGAPDDDENGLDSGSAHVFVRSEGEWTHQAKLLALDGGAFDNFGGSLAIYQDTIVAAAKGDDDKGSSSGSAHVFVRSGGEWTHQVKLLAPDGAEYDGFRKKVAIYENTIVVGAPGDDDWRGSAHVFVRSGGEWTHQAKLLAHPFGWKGTRYDSFYQKVAIYHDTIVISAWGDGDNGSWIGSVHVFVRSGGEWTHQAMLLAPNEAVDDDFGESVAIHEDTIVIATRGNNGEDRSRLAHVFVRNGEEWTHQAKLGAAHNCRIGRVVTIHEDTIVFAAYCSEEGEAHVFVA